MGERKRKMIYSDAEKCLVELDRLAKSEPKKTEICRSLIKWYMTHHSWTEKQWYLVKSLSVKRKKIKEKSKYYLYAITDGTNIKLGYSSNIPKRISAIQTGNAGNIKCLWKYYTGHRSFIASNAERKLHRRCKKYRIRGEWYKNECMELVEGFSIKKKNSWRPLTEL